MARRPTDSAGPSRASPKSEFSRIRYLQNARQVSLRSSAASSSSSASAAQPLLLTSTHNDEEIQAQLKTPRLLPSSSANSTIANNEDLLTLILRYLPPKSLLRFQAVSKPWLSFISNPTFRRLHSRFYPTTATFSAEAATAPLFVFREINGARDLNFISLCVKDVRSMATITSRLGNFLNGEIMSLHSCNGLLSMDVKFNDDLREFIVYNPTTNQHRMIPRCEPEEEGFDFLTINIAFDPVKSDHYKLVSVWADDEGNGYLLMVYSSETRIWRKLDRINELVGDSYHFEKGVFWNGDLYWASEWCGILRFDLVKGRMRELIDHPPTGQTPYYWYDLSYFGESGGDLYYIGLNKFVLEQLEVFSLKRDRSDWVVKYFVDVASLFTLYPSMVVEGHVSSNEPWFGFHIPYLLVDEKDKKPKFVISLEDRIISYDTNDMTVKEIAEVDPGELSHSFKYASYYGWKSVYQHIETLVWIN